MKKKYTQLIFILILGSSYTLLLLGTRNYTLPKIEHYKEVKLKSTVLYAASIEYDEGRLDEAFETNIREIKKDGFVYYMSPDNLYIFEFEGRGLWGMIEGVITLHPDLKTIESISIISQEETPGLGGRIGEEDFLGQFKRKEVFPKLYLALRKKATRINEVDAITGASMTSQALIDMINESVEDFREIAGKGHANK